MKTWSLDVISNISFFWWIFPDSCPGAVTHLGANLCKFDNHSIVCILPVKELNHDSSLPLANANQGELCDFQRELRWGKLSLWIGAEVCQTFLSCHHYLGLHRTLWVTHLFLSRTAGQATGAPTWDKTPLVSQLTNSLLENETLF